MNNAFSRQTFFSKLAQTSPNPYLIEVERARGIYLYAPDGKRYMDLIAGIGVSNLGHGHPRLIRAIKEQIDRHLHVMVYGEFIQATPNLLAEQLTQLLPAPLDCCYFVNSGTEANEGALKLAKRYTGRTEMVAFYNAYHGSTHGSLSVSGNEHKKYAFRPLLPDVRFIRFNQPADLDQITSRTACVIMETIQGDAGVRIPSPAYMKALRQRCSDTGALLILDEIQCGMGRTGKMFAFEHFGIVPDILTLGKALGGGLPMGAFIANHKVLRVLTHHPPLGHITTFGGNPVCCAAALATLQVLQEENIIEDVERKGRLFEQLLQHPHIREIRRIGLMFAIDFPSAERVNRIVQRAKEKGVICYWFLSNPHCFRIAPPLIISDEEIHLACRLINEAIDETT
ncbi:MAG: aspartate aminotransferase family protein [Cyclobacteriaceae bacterium]|nr:MAG: aspartate aminotransferase family protein [Cyclobacteriaceae bacterium]